MSDSADDGMNLRGDADTTASYEPQLSTITSPPERIGPYRILSTLGEGGFGIVYLGEQRQPVKRRVALKVIKPGMDSQAVIARFEQEREALAVMDHPNIARVVDAGTTERGLPFFAMEYVKGEPITQYCDRQNLSLCERLELFVAVCEAVQHAHMKGIIHRDLKPTNVLVAVGDGGPIVKVIDFGVAKALSHTLTQATIYTEHGQLIGTPEYMSPEQAEMGATDIDTRTDIYSLGVLLYELLTGATPFDPKTLRDAGYAEIQRIIREVEPPKPSTRFSALGQRSVEIATHRQARREELARELSRELDWIPLKAMRKDRTERYRTAMELSDDIRRYLNGEALDAGPESVTYRLRKFVRRHKGPVAAVTAIICSLLAGLAGTTLAMHHARVAEDQADQRARELERVADFQAAQLAKIDVAMMGIHLRDALTDQGRAALEKRGEESDEIERYLAALEQSLVDINFTNVALKTLDESIFERAIVATNEQFEDQPLIKARLLQTIANTMRDLGLLSRALEPQSGALSIRRRLLGNEHPDTLNSVNEKGSLLRRLGRLDDVEPYFREALDVRRRILGDDHDKTLQSVSNMGILLEEQGRYADAEEYYREALSGYRTILGDDHPHTLTLLNNLGWLLLEQGKYDEADGYLRDTLQRRRRVFGAKHPLTLSAMHNLGVLCMRQGRFEEAGDHFTDALTGRRQILGDEHPDTLLSINLMGALIERQGDFAKAEKYYGEALEARRRVLGNDHPDTLDTLSDIGNALAAQGRFAEAESYHREALQTRRQVLGHEHPRTVVSINNMGTLFAQQGKHEQAKPYLREALEINRRILGDHHPQTLTAMSNMAAVLLELGHLSEAETLAAEAVELGRRALPDDHWHIGAFLVQLGRSLLARQRFAEAQAALMESHDILRSAFGPNDPRTGRVMELLAELYDAWHETEPNGGHDVEAEKWRSQLPSL